MINHMEHAELVGALQDVEMTTVSDSLYGSHYGNPTTSLETKDEFREWAVRELRELSTALSGSLRQSYSSAPWTCRPSCASW
jgi:hypothetical protein